jgi:pimeloyl-ACP methyl ester carboxylesterase
MTRLFANSIVFITGAFIGNNCWDEWIEYFEKEGYNCIAPPWPFKVASAEELRNRRDDDAIASNTISSVTDHFKGIIKSLPEKPILVGHSLGGLIVQLLLQEGLGSAGVAIHSFPPSGVNSFRFSFITAIWETMMLFTSTRKTYMISFRKWRSSIANGNSYEEQKQLYYRYAIPESKKIIRDIYRCSTRIDFSKIRPPILFTSGSSDKLVPASLNYWNYKQYATVDSPAGYTEFNNHNHLVFGQPGWKEEAESVLCWLRDLK